MCLSCLSRRRFLALTATAPLAGCDEAPDLVSDETVTRMGLEAWGQITRETPISREDSARSTLQAISARLLRAAGEQPSNWEVQLFASDQANAFALPGNKIGVYEGMFAVADSEAQLAAVIGHEIGHLDAEHAQKRMSAQVAKGIGMRLVAFFLDIGDVQYAREIAAVLGLGVEVGLLLPYNREQELEADALGLVTMDAAGFDPREAIALWQNMAQASGGRGPAFLATHPTPQSRIAEIEAMLRTL